MSQTLAFVKQLIAARDAIVSVHGEEELANDAIALSDLLSTIDQALVVEDYPDYAKGPCVLVLQRDSSGRPVHALSGIRRGSTRPAVLITAYRPDANAWSKDYLMRRT